MTALKGLSCLPRLSCIEISTSYRHASTLDNSLQYDDGGNSALVHELHQELHGLSKVYIVSKEDLNDGRYQFEIWKFASDTWRRKDIDEGTYQAAVRKEGRIMKELE